METIYKLKTHTVKLKVRDNIETEAITTIKIGVKLAREIFKPLDVDQEHFAILFLNARNQISRFKILFSGGQNEASVDPIIIFRNALLFGANSIILAHNHPSGNPEPSSADFLITTRIKKAGEILGITVLDHIIIATEQYYSFAEKSEI